MQYPVLRPHKAYGCADLVNSLLADMKSNFELPRVDPTKTQFARRFLFLANIIPLSNQNLGQEQLANLLFHPDPNEYPHVPILNSKKVLILTEHHP